MVNRSQDLLLAFRSVVEQLDRRTKKEEKELGLPGGVACLPSHPGPPVRSIILAKTSPEKNDSLSK